MSLIGGIVNAAAGKKLGDILLKVGAPVLADIVKKNVGEGPGKVVEKLGEALGVTPTPEAVIDIIEKEPAAAEPVARSVETDNAALWDHLAASADAVRLATYQIEHKEPWWAWAWRPGWMWLLGVFWIWRMMIAPFLGGDLISIADLITLTLIIAGFYMGGHTLKDIGEKAVEAVKVRAGV